MCVNTISILVFFYIMVIGNVGILRDLSMYSMCSACCMFLAIHMFAGTETHDLSTPKTILYL